MGPKILAGQDDMVAEWMKKRIPMFEYGSTPYTALGVLNKAGIMLAGILYEDFRLPNIQVHVAALPKAKWATRHTLGELFRYPFEQLGCERITGLVPSRNEAAAAFDEHLGFKLEGRVRRALPNGDDVLIYGMLKEECRWLGLGRKRGYTNQFH